MRWKGDVQSITIGIIYLVRVRKIHDLRLRLPDVLGDLAAWVQSRVIREEVANQEEYVLR
jgi:hypothetical protein